ncbi:hypothetical protein MO973_24125 [Paenibacillus sp. TRM 82003]|nr:hypothetical protein [Paenibacillus sp. TRM 82003]
MKLNGFDQEKYVARSSPERMVSLQSIRSAATEHAPVSRPAESTWSVRYTRAASRP